MGSPITFSGFNDIDFAVVVNAIMQQASQPLQALQQRQAALQSQITTLGTLGTRIDALRSATGALDDPAQIVTFAGTSSEPSAVGISAGAGAVAGRHEVVVNELARAQVTASGSTAPGANTTIVASGGTITIGGVAVALSGDVTLQGLASAINGTAGIGARASVVRTAEAEYRLVLTSATTGTASAFTVVNGLTGGAGVTFADTDGNGTTGDSAADNAANATDALLTVDGLTITSTSNTLADVIPGVTLTLYQKDPAKTIGIDVASDSAALHGKVESFISSYNDLVALLEEQRAAAGKGDPASLGRDPLLRQLRSRLRTELLSAHGTAAFTRLGEVGVVVSNTGTLTLDAAKFDAAIVDDPDAVTGLFSAAGGVFPAIDGVLDEYAQASGFLSSARTRLTKQVQTMDDQIASMQARLGIQRESLQREFAAVDAMMSRLENQSNSLASLGSSFGSF